MTCSLRPFLAVIVLVGCASEQGASDQGPGGEDNPVPEPAEATQLEEEPAGEVVEVGNEPEEIVADPETGLVTVGFREPDQLALIDGASGEMVQSLELPSSPRHLQLAAPGGPVLVPSESATVFVQVGLPRVIYRRGRGHGQRAGFRHRQGGGQLQILDPDEF